MRNYPDHQFRKVQKALKEGSELNSSDTSLIALYELLANNNTDYEDIYESFELYADEETKHLLNAAILGKATNEEISEALDMSLTTVISYRKLFFDNSVFRHSLDIIRYINNLNCDEEYQKLYTQSIEQGGAYLLNKYRIGEKKKLDPITIIKTVMNDQYERFLAHRGKPLDNDVTQFALKLGQQAVSTATSLINVDKTDTNKSAVMELHLALKTNDLTNSVQLDEKDNIITE